MERYPPEGVRHRAVQKLWNCTGRVQLLCNPLMGQRGRTGIRTIEEVAGWHVRSVTSPLAHPAIWSIEGGYGQG
jgi:hypothetical protein